MPPEGGREGGREGGEGGREGWREGGRGGREGGREGGGGREGDIIIARAKFGQPSMDIRNMKPASTPCYHDALCTDYCGAALVD